MSVETEFELGELLLILGAVALIGYALYKGIGNISSTISSFLDKFQGVSAKERAASDKITNCIDAKLNSGCAYTSHCGGYVYSKGQRIPVVCWPGIVPPAEPPKIYDSCGNVIKPCNKTINGTMVDELITQNDCFLGGFASTC